jgi:hypothetical protein
MDLEIRRTISQSNIIILPKNTKILRGYAIHNLPSKKEINKKKKASLNTALPPTRRQKPTHKSPTAAGMRQCKRSTT